MLVVPDLADMFLPLSEGFLVDPIESRCVARDVPFAGEPLTLSYRSVIESLLDSLPYLAAESQIVEAALGGPMRAAVLSLVRPHPFV